MKKIYWIALGFLILTGAILCWHTTASIPMAAGGKIELKSASLLSSICGSECVLEYKTSSTTSGRIELFQDLFKWPVIVIPSTNSGVFLCLIYNDVDVQLLRFDTTQAFKTVPRRTHIARLVLTSSCDYGEANFDEWCFVRRRLNQMSTHEFRKLSLPDLNLGILSIYGDPPEWTRRMDEADEVQYPGDVLYPDPRRPGRYVKHPQKL
jgi:hypothetical protein